MVVILGQEYNVGEKPTVILYTFINRHAEQPNIAKTKQKQHSTSSNWVVIFYFFIGCKDKTSAGHLNGFSDGSNLGSTI